MSEKYNELNKKQLYEYRIVKYNPKFRINGIYTKNEWTSISDIGDEFDGVFFTKTNSLWVCMFLHSLNNFTTVGFGL